ncbi:hypothetical protein F5141DRAFT_1067745 [Pisolithus sp. B1]|nr:hypothetical protein F5141DRAFT_1067745 [Pisolithus sp. B1]
MTDRLPTKVAHNGHNWTTYTSLVLCAITAKGLMEFLVGSERQPTHPAELQGQVSEPETTTETCQEAHKSNDKLKTSPSGHEDPVDSPSDGTETTDGHAKPKTKVIDMQQVEPHLPEVEGAAMESKWLDKGADKPEAPDKGSQSASNEAEDSKDLMMSSEALETQGDLPFTTSKCTKTQTEHREPENEVVDMQQVVDVLLMFEVGTTGRTWHGKHVKEHEAPDDGSQCASNKVAESRNLPEMSCKALNPVDSIAGQTSGHPTDHIPQMPIKEKQHAWTHSEMITNVPDPPGTHTEHPAPCIKCPTLQRKSDKLPTQAGLGDSATVELKMTTLEMRAVSANTVEIQVHIPCLERHPKEPDKATVSGGVTMHSVLTAGVSILDGR